MTLRERRQQHTSTPPETVEIEGLGPIRIRRVKASEMRELAELPDNQATVALVAKCVLDDDGGPAFPGGPAEVEQLDWPLVQSLIAACSRVNNVTPAPRSA